MFIREGMKARFCPSYLRSAHDGREGKDAKSILGTVAYVNWDHRVFTVEYAAGDTIQTEAFHFFDIGKSVTLYG